jgi:hypothetical protein
MLEQSSVSAGYAFSIAEGEILVLDKYKKVMAAGATIADTDVIYICQGLGSTYSLTNEPGTAMTSLRRLRVSDPIVGKNVKAYNGESYAAKSEQVTTVDFTGVTPVVATEYIFRIVYRDIWEHPGQYTATYRYISTTATLSTFLDAVVVKINKHSGRRVIATDTATALILTGLAIPQCTTGLNDLDPFTMVEFRVFCDYVNSKGQWTLDGVTSTTNVAPGYGTGNWENVRDIERAAWSYLGITNRTHYPIILPDACTVVGATYDIITIEHEAPYLSPDNQYMKHAPLTTQIAFRVPSTGTQEQAVLAVLNPWFESCPGSFLPVSV